MENDNTNSLDNLILNGVVEVASIDESGNFLYKFTENAKAVDPELHDRAMEIFYNNLMSLWTKGFVSMDVTEAEPIVEITEKATHPGQWRHLDRMETLTLQTIMKAMRK